MLSNASRLLTYLTAALALVTGLPLFFAPETFAPVFAWKVTPFMVMTIGAWCLGNAWLAFWIARRWRWVDVQVAAVYLWLFGLLEMGVLIAFRDKLVLAHPVAWLYLAMIVATFLTSVVSIIDWLRLRPVSEASGPRAGTITIVLAWIFFIFVCFLGLYGLFAPMGGPGTNGGIFPEVMSPFTLRAFGAFYLSLGLPVFLILRHRNLDAILFYSIAAYSLIVIVTAAALVYLRLFNFAAAPGGLAYFGAYIGVGIVIAIILIQQRDRVRELLRPA
jgi:hypothetical protein